MKKKIRIAMIGGGPGSFIGNIHRIAMRLDNDYDLVAGSFSSSIEKSKITGDELGLDPSRIYPDYTTLIKKELQLPAEERIEAVSIVTPNHMHFAPAKLALENGIHVVLDKPATLSLREAIELQKTLENSTAKFCLTHTYTGYPMVKEARYQVLSGNLGKIKKVVVSYPQGWLSKAATPDNKQAAWRTDPSKSGIAGAMGDIGTHAFNLLEYVTGLKVAALSAQVNTIVPHRLLDDDGAAFLQMENGAAGVLLASQVATGEENNLSISVYGENAGLKWQQSDNESLIIKNLDAPDVILRRGEGYLSSYAKHNTRTPSGHPEGYLEAFANIYHNFALTLRAFENGDEPQKEWLDFPGIEDAVRGMAFIETIIQNGKSSDKWTSFPV